jgi:hypothetical protein
MNPSRVLMMLVMLGTQWMRWARAQRRAIGTNHRVLMVTCAGLTPVLLLFIWRLNTATERAHAAWLASRR